MKKLATLIGILAVLIAIYSTPVLGTETEPLERGMFFGSRAACEATWNTGGEFRFYTPDPENLRVPPAQAKGLPRAGCALEDVRENKGESPTWVILAPNTLTVFGIDGIPIMDGRCWNKIHDFAYLPLLRGLPGRDGLQGLKGDTGPKGLKGDKGEDFTPEDRFDGWCGFWSDLGCTVLAGVIVGGTVYYVATQGGDDKKKPGPVVHTDPPTFKVGLAPRVGFIPPRNGRGGGMFIGGSVSFK